MSINKLPPFPKLGISLEGIEAFIKECGGESSFINQNVERWNYCNISVNQIDNMTTKDVSEKYIKPLTKKANMSYCNLLNSNNNYIGIATIFISHAWKYEFLNVVNNIRKYELNRIGKKCMNNCNIHKLNIVSTPNSGCNNCGKKCVNNCNIHKLNRFSTPKDNYYCINCKEDGFLKDTIMYKCETCNYGLCEKCYPNRDENLIVSKYRCRTCNYDLCEKCYINRDENLIDMSQYKKIYFWFDLYSNDQNNTNLPQGNIYIYILLYKNIYNIINNNF